MTKPVYPAVNNQQAVDLNILNSNIFHNIVNGDATTDVPTYEGNGTIPSVAKALHTMAAYKAPIPWEEGASEADILQPRVFADNIFVPIRVPAVMDSTPSDLYWKLYLPTVRESLNDTGENYFREVLKKTKSTFVVPFDIKTYPVNGVERPQVTVFVHKGNDVVEKIDVAELTYVDKNTFTLLNPATAGNIVEIYSTTIAAFTIVGAIRDDVYLAKDAVHADMLAAEQASTDAQAARDVAIAQRDVVIAEGDTQVARVVSEGTQQVTLATEQAVRAEAAASVAEEASSKAYAPQSIIKALTGLCPVGWTVADCDAPVCSILADRILPHSTHYGQSEIARASSESSATYQAWKAFNGTAVDDFDCWSATTGTGVSVAAPAWLRYDFLVPRALGTKLYLTTRKVAAASNPKDFEIRGVRVDGSVDVLGSFVNQAAVSNAQVLTYAITPVASVLYKAFYLHITGSPTNYVTIANIHIEFADAPTGSISIPAGLQVSYADAGQVRLSTELAAPQSVDLSAAADGTYHIAVNINADGSFAAPSSSSDCPQIGTRNLLAYPVPVAASATAPGRDIGFSVDGDPATYWGPGTSGAAVIGVWVEFTLPDSKSGAKSIIATSFASYVGSAPNTADVEQLVGGVWTKVGELVYIGNTLRGSFDSVEGNNTVRLKATAATVNASYGWTMSDIQISNLTAGDLYNPNTVTMYDKDGNPIRRVYLGWVEKFGGAITDVHCYSLGSSVTVPVNNGDTVAKNTTVVDDLPYIFSRNANAKAQIFAEGFWGNVGWIYSSSAGGHGTKASLVKDSLRIYTGTNALSSNTSDSGGDFTPGISTPCRVRVTMDRGY